MWIRIIEDMPAQIQGVYAQLRAGGCLCLQYYKGKQNEFLCVINLSIFILLFMKYIY